MAEEAGGAFQRSYPGILNVPVKESGDGVPRICDMASSTHQISVTDAHLSEVEGIAKFFKRRRVKRKELMTSFEVAGSDGVLRKYMYYPGIQDLAVEGAATAAALGGVLYKMYHQSKDHGPSSKAPSGPVGADNAVIAIGALGVAGGAARMKSKFKDVQKFPKAGYYDSRTNKIFLLGTYYHLTE